MDKPITADDLQLLRQSLRKVKTESCFFRKDEKPVTEENSINDLLLQTMAQRREALAPEESDSDFYDSESESTEF